MGISTHVYGYLGVKIPWDDKLHEVFEEYLENDREGELPEHVFDYMGGGYHVLGIKLYDSGDFRWGMEGGDEYREIDISKFPEMEASYKAEFIKKMPQFAHYMEKPFSMLIFTHYS
jgi:hypothetical protein